MLHSIKINTLADQCCLVKTFPAPHKRFKLVLDFTNFSLNSVHLSLFLEFVKNDSNFKITHTLTKVVSSWERVPDLNVVAFVHLFTKDFVQFKRIKMQ